MPRQSDGKWHVEVSGDRLLLVDPEGKYHYGLPATQQATMNRLTEAANMSIESGQSLYRPKEEVASLEVENKELQHHIGELEQERDSLLARVKELEDDLKQANAERMRLWEASL